ncbi:FecR domain-containing protein [Maricaulis sp.]|uniref:FecR family protein n=1 Tax=Maricaulis sp. TaxID=1486257 RepID=UPI003299B31A
MSTAVNYPAADRHEQASYWLVQMRKADCSAATRKAFRIWMEESDANRSAYDAVRHAWSASAALEHSPVFEALRRDALIESVRRRRARPPVWAMALAAGLVMMIGAALFMQPGWRMGTGLESAGETVVAEMASVRMPSPEHTIETIVGERSTVPLEDGSQVELNTSTEVRLAFSPQQREVVMLRGQAVFNVSHDPERPFVVLAGDRRITAIGTEFEVRIDGDDVSVTLLEGRVEVAEVVTRDGEEAGRVVELEPGQRLAGRDVVAEQVDAESLDRAMSWRRGRLVFENEPLSAAVAEVNRYSRQQIGLADEDLGDLRVSGTFWAGSVENFLSAVTTIYPLEAEREDGAAQIVLDWRGQDG